MWGGINVISKNSAKLMRFLPDKVVFKIARKAIDGYLDKYEMCIRDSILC